MGHLVPHRRTLRHLGRDGDITTHPAPPLAQLAARRGVALVLHGMPPTHASDPTTRTLATLEIPARNAPGLHHVLPALTDLDCTAIPSTAACIINPRRPTTPNP